MTIRIASIVAAAAFGAVAATGAFAQDVSPLTASTVDRPSTPAVAIDSAAAYSPGSIGAMHYAVAGQPTSADAVRRQNPGLLTAVAVRWTVAPSQQPGS